MGRVLEALKAAGKAEDTLVVFFSDNGGHMGATSCKPLRGAKGTLYEGGIRVPMIVRWPGKVKPGSRSGTPVIGTDLYPTFLAVAGAKGPEGYTLDGEDITPVLAGKDVLAERPLFWHFPAYLQGRFEKDMFRTRPGAVVRRGKWKLIEFFEDRRLELYDLAQDRGEKNNVATEHGDITRELHGLMTTWRQNTGAPVPTKANPKFDPDAGPTRGGGG
jgi:arylsulfatase A-like enzyme